MRYGSLPNSMNRRTSALILGMLCMMQAVLMPGAWAQQCFADAHQAYAHLINEQQNQQLAEQSVTVHLNSATEGELTQLTGIGSSKAQQIILYRDAFGPFGSVDDLAKVKGIGDKTVAKNRARMSIE